MTLTIRVTQAEKDAIVERAMYAGKNLTEYILAASQGAEIILPPDVTPLLKELKRMGNNLNQIAARVNSGAAYAPGLREVAEGQRHILRQLRELTEASPWPR